MLGGASNHRFAEELSLPGRSPQRNTFFTDPEEEKEEQQEIQQQQQQRQKQQSSDDAREEFSSGNNFNTTTSKPLSRTDTTSTYASKAFQTAASPFSWQRNHEKGEGIFNTLDAGKITTHLTIKDAMKDSSGSVFSPKKGLEDSLKNKSSSSSTNRSSYSDEKSIEHAKEQLRARSYYATFKILSTISLMMFLPPMLSLFVDLSCMGSSDYCVPHFEMHMDTLKTENDRYILQHIAKGIEIISERADTNTFPLERIEETLTGLANKTGTVYKLNHFGYCRMERGDGNSQESTSDWFEECHTLFDGTDVPSVLLKDVVYEMESSRELDITSPEKDSNKMVSIFRKQLQKSHESSNKLIYYSSMGLSFSMAFVILKITAIVFDTFALFLVFGVALHVKTKTGAVSNSKVKGWLTLATGCLLFSSIVQLLTMIFERAYHEDLYQILTETSFSFIHHFNYFTSGTVIHIIGMSAQVMVIISMFLLISAKPWVVKVVL